MSNNPTGYPDNYPTREQILTELYVPLEIECNTVERWKRTFYNKRWGNTSLGDKMDALKKLIGNICESRNTPKAELPILFVSKHPWAYIHDLKLIKMELDSPSIISTLHELGHYLHLSGYLEGKKEMTEFVACRYSVGIYKACFPKAYAKLIWSDHALITPKESLENSAA